MNDLKMIRVQIADHIAGHLEQNMTMNLRSTKDSREATHAFVEKRKPVFKGC